MLKKCQNGEKDPCGFSLYWAWGSWGSSDKTTYGKKRWKSVKMVKRILDDPLWIGLGGS
jgi:hypothetical protein